MHNRSGRFFLTRVVVAYQKWAKFTVAKLRFEATFKCRWQHRQGSETKFGLSCRVTWGSAAMAFGAFLRYAWIPRMRCQMRLLLHLPWSTCRRLHVFVHSFLWFLPFFGQKAAQTDSRRASKISDILREIGRVGSPVLATAANIWAGDWTEEEVASVIKGGLRCGKCQRDKQALQIFLGRLQLDDADVVVYEGTKLHVPAAELWKELVLDVHGASHLSPR